MIFRFALRRRLPGTALLGLSLLACTPAAAVQINLSYDDYHNPAFDPDGALLLSTARAAADIWESLLTGSKTYNWEVAWDPALTGLGQSGALGNIIMNPDASGAGWYIDPTPLDHSEFDFSGDLMPTPEENQWDGTTLVTNLAGIPGAVDAWFNGLPPGYLELGYRGVMPAGTAGAGQHDLLGSLVHELGHSLGIDDVFSDYPLYSFHVGGRSVEVVGEFSTSSGAHLVAPPLLMAQGNAQLGQRRLPSAADVLAVARHESLGVNLERVYYVGDTDGLGAIDDWNHGRNWLGGSTPNTETTVRLFSNNSMRVTANATAGNLRLEGGADLTIEAFNQLSVTEDLVVGLGDTAAQPSHIQVGTGQLLSGQLVLHDNGYVTVTGGSVQGGAIEIGAANRLSGYGNVFVTNGQLVNDGVIAAAGGQTLTLSAAAGQPTWQLHGNGSGLVRATAGSILFSSGRLVADFAGSMTVFDGRSIGFDEGWTLAPTGSLVMAGTSSDAVVRSGTGYRTVLLGVPNVVGRARFEGDTWLGDATGTVVSSWNLALDSGERLTLAGDTWLWNATITGEATVLQNGDLNVQTGVSTIDVETYDWDGGGNSATSVGTNATLFIKTETGIDLSGDGHDGTINNAGNLIVDSFGPFTNPFNGQTTLIRLPWRVEGELNLQGNSYTAGSRLEIAGALNVIGDGNVIGSDLVLRDTGTTQIDGTLRTVGRTTTLGSEVAGTGRWNLLGDLVVAGDTTISVDTLDLDADLLSEDPTLTRVTVNNGYQLLISSADIAPAPYSTVVVESGAEMVVDRAGTPQWLLYGNIELQGGELAGDPLVHLGEIRGFGNVTLTRLENRGVIAAEGGTLNLGVLFDTNLGASPGDGLEAKQGDIVFTGFDTEIDFRGSMRLGDGGATLRTIDLGSDKTLLSAGFIDINNGRLILNTLDNQSFGLIRGMGVVVGEMQNDGRFEPTRIAISGDFTQSAAGRTNLLLTAESAASPMIPVLGGATIDGQLGLKVDAGFAPTPYQSFALLDSAVSLTGQFAQINGVGYAPGRGLAVTYLSDQVLVTEALLGDTDLDGDVDDSDLGTAFSNYNGPVGNAGGGTWIRGDMDGDGDIDDSDLGTLFSDYTGPIAVNIPEPGSLTLLAMSGLLVRRLQRRGR